MIEKLIKDTHPRPAWTMIKDGRRIQFGPKPWKVLWGKIKQIVVFSILLVPCADAANDFRYRKTVTPFIVELSLGNIPGKATNNKFGRSQNVDSGVATDIWGGSDGPDNQPLWTHVTAARIHEIYSVDADDTSSGDGCRTVSVSGVGHGDMSIASETVSMAGNTYVPTLNTYQRINRMACETFGVTEMNEGNIYAIAQVDASTQIVVTANFGQSLHGIWTCPLGKTCLITNYYASMNKSGGASGAIDLTLFTRDNTTSEHGWRVRHSLGAITTGSSHFGHAFNPYFKIAEKTDIKVQAIGSANDLDVSAGFDVIIVDN